MTNQMQLKWNDYDGDLKTSSFGVRDESYATQAAKLDTLTTALEAWGIGRLHTRNDVREVVSNGPGSAISPVAQGALTAIFEVEDLTTGIIYREKLPMPDLTKIADGANAAWIKTGQGSNSLTIANPDHAGYASLKTAYDAVGVSQEGNNTSLRRVYIEE